MMLVHEATIGGLDLLVVRLWAHAEHAMRCLQALRAVFLSRAARREPANDLLELCELGAAEPERPRDAPKRLALLAADDAGAERGLQLDLHERARQAAATVGERLEAIIERVAGALSAREMLDRFLHLRVAQAHGLHDAPRDLHFVLGNTAVGLRDVPHDLEGRLEKQPPDLVESVTHDDAEQRADGPADECADEPADPFAEPLHSRSEPSRFLRAREVAETRREGSLSCLRVAAQ